MSVVSQATLESYFLRGKRPTQAQYKDLVDTLFSMSGGGGPTPTLQEVTTAGNTTTTSITANAFIGNGAGLTGLPTPTLQQITDAGGGTTTGNLTAGGFSGDGSGLTNLPFIVSENYADLQTMVGANGLHPGQMYRVQDRPIDLIIFASSTNTFADNAIRAQLLPNSYAVGVVDGINWIGVWRPTLTPAAGDACIWGGTVWVNNAGNNGFPTGPLTLDSEWTQVDPFDIIGVASGYYRKAYFHCKYDFANDWIHSQVDRNGNMFGQTWEEEQFHAYGLNGATYSDWGASSVINMFQNKGHVFINNIIVGEAIGNTVLYTVASDIQNMNYNSGEAIENVVSSSMAHNRFAKIQQVQAGNISGNTVLGDFSNLVISGDIVGNTCTNIVSNTCADILFNNCDSIGGNDDGGNGYNISRNSGTALSIGAGTMTGPIEDILHSDGDVIISSSASGLILQETGGPNYWRVQVSSLGVLTTTNIGTAPF